MIQRDAEEKNEAEKKRKKVIEQVKKSRQSLASGRLFEVVRRRNMSKQTFLALTISLLACMAILTTIIAANPAMSAPDAARHGDPLPAQRACSVPGVPTCTPTPVPPRDSDGDGVPDDVDACPTVPGSASNGGCPEPTPIPPINIPQPPTDTDGDGDGTPNDADACPTVPGSAANGGCPQEQAPPDEVPSALPTVVLPVMPTTGDCVATPGDGVNVNIRSEPDMNAEIIGMIVPGVFVQVFLQQQVNEASNTWLRIHGGWVASWVVVMGGDCSQLPVLLVDGTTLAGDCVATPSDGATVNIRSEPDVNAEVIGMIAPGEFVQVFLQQQVNDASNVWLRISGGWVDSKGIIVIGGCSQLPMLAVDGTTLSFAGLQIMPYSENVDAAFYLHVCTGVVQLTETLPDCPADEMLVIGFTGGLDALSFNSQPEPPGESIAPGSDLEALGFNPQPEPPGLQSVVLGAGLDELSFNPQPEPPGEPFLMTRTTADGTIQQIMIRAYMLSTPGAIPPLDLLTFVDAESGQVFACPSSELSFNPQPEPPGDVMCYGFEIVQI